VQYEELISSVRNRGVPRRAAETLTHATLRVLAERLTGGEADDLRAQLPGELQADLIPPTPEAEPFGPAEFAQRVARQAKTEEDAARQGMVAVLATTREALTSICSTTPRIPGATPDPAATARSIASGLLMRSGSTTTCPGVAPLGSRWSTVRCQMPAKGDNGNITAAS
jgi:uncharacterized protein (DUF2267 family)